MILKGYLTHSCSRPAQFMPVPDENPDILFCAIFPAKFSLLECATVGTTLKLFKKR